MNIRNDLPALGYLASEYERFCSAPAEEIPALVRAAGDHESSELLTITHRLLANGAADLIELGRYLETVSESDPGAAARMEAFIKALLPVRG